MLSLPAQDNTHPTHPSPHAHALMKPSVLPSHSDTHPHALELTPSCHSLFSPQAHSRLPHTHILPRIYPSLACPQPPHTLIPNSIILLLPSHTLLSPLTFTRHPCTPVTPASLSPSQAVPRYPPNFFFFPEDTNRGHLGLSSKIHTNCFM